MVAGGAAAGNVTLHPSGFGQQSYAAWKAQQGQPDFTGSDDQSLYFQKMTATATVAAGVAVFKGFEGMDTSALGYLGFSYRRGTHCRAGAPRSIVYDEGDDVGASPGCPGFISCVYLDNIRVGSHLWTSASDNGNGQTITMSTDPVDELLGEPLDVALAQT